MELKDNAPWTSTRKTEINVIAEPATASTASVPLGTPNVNSFGALVCQLFSILRRNSGQIDFAHLPFDGPCSGGTSAEVDCYAQFNQKGWIYGHCGRDYVGNLKGCRPE